MNYDEKILNFFEGDLNQYEEKDLFQELLNEPNLRANMREYYEINSAIKNDYEAFSPPIETEKNLALALQTMAIGGAETLSTGASSGIATSTVLSKLGYISSLILTFFIGSIFTNSFNSPSLPKYFNNNINTTSVTSNLNEKNTLSKNVVLENTNLNKKAISDNHEKFKTITKIVYKDRILSNYKNNSSNSSPLANMSITPNSNINTEVLKNDSNNFKDISFTNNRFQNENMIVNVNSDKPVNFNSGINVNTNMPFEYENIPKFKSKIAFAELRYQYQKSIFKTISGEGENSIYDDMSLGMYVNFLPTFALGFETGQERYAQTLKVNSGDTVYLDQRPRYFWSGISGRYSQPIEKSFFLPYIQGTIGATSVGPLFRGRLGFDYEFTSSIGFTFA